jgi:NADH dehydrogenase
LNIPFFAARIVASGLDLASTLTGGLFKNGMLTRDQVTSLRVNNVVGASAKTLADLGVKPTDMDAVLPEYLWPFRPTGQYAAIKNSAKNLK